MTSSTPALILVLALLTQIYLAEPITTPTDSSQLSSVIASKYSAFSACRLLLSSCQPTISSCASSVCASCTGLGQSYINSCCASGSAPTSCFISVKSAGGGNQYPSTETPPPPPTNTAPYGPLTDPGFTGCESVSSYQSICESLTPGFTTLTAFQLQAPCLCYAGQSWAPQVYDGWVEQCNSYITSTPSITAPCQNVGDVVASFSSYESSLHSTVTPATTHTTTTTSNIVGFVKAPRPVSVLITLTVVILVVN